LTMTMGVSLLSLVVLSLLKGYALSLSLKRIYTKYVTLPTQEKVLTNGELVILLYYFS